MSAVNLPLCVRVGAPDTHKHTPITKHLVNHVGGNWKSFAQVKLLNYDAKHTYWS